MKQLTIKEIPEEDNDLYRLILILADLTVMIRWSSINIKGQFITSSGFTNSVDIYTEDKNVNCFCLSCDQSKQLTTSWALIHVITSANQFGRFDVESTICCVGYDDYSSSTIKLSAQKMGMADMEGDRLVISFSTHDIGFAKNLKLKCREYDDLCKILYDKNIGTRDVNRNVIIVSHPHGCPKQVSIGKLLDKEEQADGSSRLAYDTPTCPGSSGAPVYVTGMCAYASNHTHSGSNFNTNFSGLWFI